MDLLIKVNNISQIRQITKSLPQDILKQAVVDEKPVLSYLWNTPVFSNKDGMFSVENVNREFILSNTGVLQDANDRVLAYLDNSKADFLSRSGISSLSSLLSNLIADSKSS